MRSEREKMLAGALYSAVDPELLALCARAEAWALRYDASPADPPSVRLAMLRELLGAVGDDEVQVRPPFRCDYGFNIHLGPRAFLNFGCVILDGRPVHIGARSLLAPGVKILTAEHPRDVETRRAGLEMARPVTIGADVWIGADALILPGVTVGDGAIVGAGAVVNRDVPAGATVAGNPARIVKQPPAA